MCLQPSAALLSLTLTDLPPLRTQPQFDLAITPIQKDKYIFLLIPVIPHLDLTGLLTSLKRSVDTAMKNDITKHAHILDLEDPPQSLTMSSPAAKVPIPATTAQSSITSTSSPKVVASSLCTAIINSSNKTINSSGPIK